MHPHDLYKVEGGEENFFRRLARLHLGRGHVRW
jgi:hypothetical protein